MIQSVCIPQRDRATLQLHQSVLREAFEHPRHRLPGRADLSKMKNGHISAIRFSTLAAICDVLKCQPGDILEYSPEEKDN